MTEEYKISISDEVKLVKFYDILGDIQLGLCRNVKNEISKCKNIAEIIKDEEIKNDCLSKLLFIK